MNARIPLPLIVACIALAACSGGGSNSTPQAVGSGTTATGTLVIAVPQTSGSAIGRKPAFVSSATRHAAVFVNFSNTNSGSTSSCTSTSCTITWNANLPTFPGTYNFAVELDDNSTNCGGRACVLGEGAQTYTLVAGPNGTLSPPLLINGVAVNADFYSESISNNVALESLSIADADGVDITSYAGSGLQSGFDNGSWPGETGNGLVTVSIATGATTNAVLACGSCNGNTSGNAAVNFPYLGPNPTGNNEVTAICSTPYTAGSFTLAINAGTPSGDITANELSSLNLSYPGDFIATTGYTFNCDGSGNISVGASGNVQVQSAGRVRQ